MRHFILALITMAFGTAAAAGVSQAKYTWAYSPLVGSGKSITQVRTLNASISAVEVVGSIDVVLTRGEGSAVEVVGEDNLVELVETRLVGGTLRVGLKAGANIRPTTPLKVFATAPEIKKATVSGSGSLTLKELDQLHIRLEAVGSGDIKAHGQVPSTEMLVSGSGSINASRVKASYLIATLQGSGDIAAYADGAAKVRVSGSGDVVVDGSPKHRDAKVSGSGDIEFN